MSKVSFEDQRWGHSDQSWQEKHRMAYELFRSLSFWRKAKIISIAEGDGLFLRNIEAGSKTAIDFSQVAIDKCKKKGLEAYKVDVEKKDLPFRDKEFDVAFLIDVCEHVWQPEELLKKASRVSKHVIVTVPNFAFLKDRLQLLFGSVPQSMGRGKGHCYFMTLLELKRVVEASGLQIVRSEAYYPLKHRPLLGKISYLIYLLFPSLWATSYAILLEEK